MKKVPVFKMSEVAKFDPALVVKVSRMIARNAFELGISEIEMAKRVHAVISSSSADQQPPALP